MSINLQQTLSLAGKLDDISGPDTPRERFRQFLHKNVTKVGEIRGYIEECLRTSGDQYSRALQNLVNHLGHFLGSAVTFGRYQGVQGQIGFDGLMNEYDVSHDDVLAVLRPSGPTIDSIVGLMARLVAQWQVEEVPEKAVALKEREQTTPLKDVDT